jgi:hypothetical protein
MLEVVVGEEVEAIEEVADVDAAKRVHSREREDKGEAGRRTNVRQLSGPFTFRLIGK